jgi:hypothetical protein
MTALPLRPQIKVKSGAARSILVCDSFRHSFHAPSQHAECIIAADTVPLWNVRVKFAALLEFAAPRTRLVEVEESTTYSEAHD